MRERVGGEREREGEWAHTSMSKSSRRWQLNIQRDHSAPELSTDCGVGSIEKQEEQ